MKPQVLNLKHIPGSYDLILVKVQRSDIFVLARVHILTTVITIADVPIIS